MVFHLRNTGSNTGTNVIKFTPLLLIAALSACATGPSLQESAAEFAPLSPDRGRIVVYRTGIMGTGVQPTVTVDGAERGKCQPNGAFSVDVAPGERVVSARTEGSRQIAVNVEPGQTSYVRCSIGFGFVIGQVNLEAVPRAVGESESAPLSLIGRF